MYDGKFNQILEVIINSQDHDTCLAISKVIKKQCEAWYFCVTFNESKSVRKGPVLSRDILIYQTAYASDIVIFKEAIRRICFHFSLFAVGADVRFSDRGSEPENDLRKSF